MKGKKIFGLLLASALSVALCFNVFAGEYALDPAAHLDDGANKVWMNDGCDGLSTGVDMEIFKAAKEIRIEFNKVPADGVMSFAWLGAGNDWSWKQDTREITGTSVTYEMKSFQDWSRAVSGDAVKFFVCDWASNDNGMIWEDGDLKITAITFIGDYPEDAPAAAEEAPAAAEEAPAASAPKTGDNNMLVLFGILLMVSVAGLTALRMAKRQKSN